MTLNVFRLNLASIYARFQRSLIFQWLAANLLQQYGVIIMLHRVAEFNAAKLPANENMKVTPQFLEKFIIDAKKHNYQFISLDQLYYRLQNGLSLKKSLVMTLDDGYLDNYTNAFHIFRRYNIPFTIYVNSAFVNQEQFPWWYQLESLLLAKSVIYWQSVAYKVTTKAEKNTLFLQIRMWLLDMGLEEFNQALAALLAENNYAKELDEDALFLHWEHLRQMLSSGLLTLGNHGHQHLHLDKLSEQQLVAEVEQANRLIHEHTQITPVHFCYPYGHIDASILAKVAPWFSTAVTTDSGFIRPDYQNKLEQLPRFFLTENVVIRQAISMLAMVTRLARCQKTYAELK